MSGNRQSSGSGAAVRVGSKKRKILLDEEQHSVLSRYVQVLNGRPDAISDFFRGFREEFSYSKIVSPEIMEQVLNCIAGKESTVVVEMEKPSPCSVFKLPINKDRG